MNSLWNWMVSHTEVISAVASLAMLLVWIFYTNLLYKQFKHQHHPRLMIHQAPDTAGDSLCLLINMGERLINIVSILITGFTAEEEVSVEISDYQKMNQSDEASSQIQNDIRMLLKQGPLSSGEYIIVGRFDHLIQNLLTDKLDLENNDYPDFQKIEVRVVVFHGKENSPIGAFRAFRIENHSDHQIRIIPSTLHTKQMVSYWQRKKVDSWIN